MWSDLTRVVHSLHAHNNVACKDLETSANNGTGYYFKPQLRTCKVVQFGVGILRPNWLAGATYLGKKPCDIGMCNVWTKAEFITYYADVKSGRPVFWKFWWSNMTEHVLTWEPNATMAETDWAIPAYCSGDGRAGNRSYPSPLLQRAQVKKLPFGGSALPRQPGQPGDATDHIDIEAPADMAAALGSIVKHGSGGVGPLAHLRAGFALIAGMHPQIL